LKQSERILGAFHPQEAHWMTGSDPQTGIGCQISEVDLLTAFPSLMVCIEPKLTNSKRVFRISFGLWGIESISGPKDAMAELVLCRGLLYDEPCRDVQGNEQEKYTVVLRSIFEGEG
jgi:hypothetical protein